MKTLKKISLGECVEVGVFALVLLASISILHRQSFDQSAREEASRNQASLEKFEDTTSPTDSDQTENLLKIQRASKSLLSQ